MLEFVGSLAVALIAPGATVPLLAVSSGVSVVRCVRRRRALRNSALKPIQDAAASENENGRPSESSPVTISWRSVNCTLSDPKSQENQRLILQNVSGIAQPGRIYAILGPSGSGKTTLLNSIAGQVPFSKTMNLSGEVSWNGRIGRPELAYVTQEDLFFSQLSVEETLEFAGRMRLSGKSTVADQKKVVDQLLRKLGLEATKNTQVGKAGVGGGISGGERKRLSLGCELMSTPKLIICDEPTSGLDAYQAAKVMQTLKKLALAGHTVICSIHQPSSSIFEMIDDILLLSSGRVVYTGARAKAAAYFQELGHEMPKYCNPAEKYLDLVSVDYTSGEAENASLARIETLVSAFAKHGVSLPPLKNESGSVTVSTGKTPSQNIFGQFRALLLRAFRQAKRDKRTNISRFMSSVMSGLLFGGIYWKLGLSQSTIRDRMGLLQVCTINCAMTALTKTLNVFPKEAVLANRERTQGAYGVFPYFTSKLLAELPLSAFFPLLFSSVVYPMAGLSGGVNRILRFAGIITVQSFAAASYGLVIGALVPNTETALALGPSSFVLQVVFGGLFVTDKNVPGWAKWIPKVSLIKHGFEGLCVNEFRGLTLEAKKPTDVTNGEQVLERLSWGDSTVANSVTSLARIVAFNYLVTFAVLTLKKPKFQNMVSPTENSDAVQIEEVGAVSAPLATTAVNGMAA